jgi:hypothetical protein
LAPEIKFVFLNFFNSFTTSVCAACSCRAHTAATRNWRFSASYDSFVVQQTFVLRMNICGKNRQLLVAANRYGLWAGILIFLPIFVEILLQYDHN